jgi:hypothetical protein
MPFSFLPPNLTYRLHPGNNLTIKNPGNEGGLLPGVMRGVMKNSYFIYITQKPARKVTGLIYEKLSLTLYYYSTQISLSAQ